MMKDISRRGFTIIEIMITVAIIGIIMSIAVPSFVKSRENVRKNSCIANLKEIDEAISLWSFGEGMGGDDPVIMSDIVGEYLKAEPFCSMDRNREGYIVTTVWATPQCPRAADYPGHVLFVTEEDGEEIPAE